MCIAQWLRTADTLICTAMLWCRISASPYLYSSAIGNVARTPTTPSAVSRLYLFSALTVFCILWLDLIRYKAILPCCGTGLAQGRVCIPPLGFLLQALQSPHPPSIGCGIRGWVIALSFLFAFACLRVFLYLCFSFQYSWFYCESCMSDCYD